MNRREFYLKLQANYPNIYERVYEGNVVDDPELKRFISYDIGEHPPFYKYKEVYDYIKENENLHDIWLL